MPGWRSTSATCWFRYARSSANTAFLPLADSIWPAACARCISSRAAADTRMFEPIQTSNSSKLASISRMPKTAL